MDLRQIDIENGLRELGLKRGDIVEVHSSLSSLGWVEGGAQTVIAALVNVVGEDGAIVMSAYPVTLPLPLSPQDREWGILAKVRFLDKDSPERTGMGAIADAFKFYPGTVLGKDFHRVCAWGREAQRLSRGYAELLASDGWALLIGVDIHRLSSMHTAEAPGLIPAEIGAMFQAPEQVTQEYPQDQWYVQYGEAPADAWGKVQAEAERRGLIRHGKIGAAECLLFKARAVVGIYEAALRADVYGLFGVQRLTPP